MMIAASILILSAMVLMLIRARMGPTVYDRILAVNMFGSATVVLIAVHCYLFDQPDFLDIALLYSLINFLGTIAVVKFVTFSRTKVHTPVDDIGDL
ncbi:MAG: hypothetical protein HQL54_03720 [Magnetococcales bacterium]|nr:hypothetical protein [Magnetococcales bacterium]